MKQYEKVYEVYLRHGCNKKATAMELGMPLNSINSQISYYEQKHSKNYKNPSKLLEATPNLALIKPMDYEKRTWEEIIDVADQTDTLHNKLFPLTNEISKTLPSDRPVVIINSADWHIGSHGVDYDAYKKKMKYILNTDGVYMIVAGDVIQNMPATFKNALPSMNQVITKKMQYAFLEDIMTDLISEEKLLAASWGNHDTEFDERLLSASVVELVLRNIVQNEEVYLPTGGFLNIHFDDSPITYRFHVTHSYRGSSKHNPLYSNYNATLEKGLWYDPELDVFNSLDATIQGHTHTPSYSWVPLFNKHIYHIKTGTYQEEGEFGNRYFPSTDVVHFPSMVLNPFEKELMVFPDSHQAMEYGKYIQEKNKERIK